MSPPAGFVRQTRQLNALFKALIYSTVVTTVLFALGLLLSHVHNQMVRQDPSGPRIPFPAPASDSDSDSVYYSGSNDNGDDDSDGHSDYYSASGSDSNSTDSDKTIRATPFDIMLDSQSDVSTIRARPRKFNYDVTRYEDTCAIESDSSGRSETSDDSCDFDDGYETDIEVDNKPKAKRPRSSYLTEKNLADLQAALA